MTVGITNFSLIYLVQLWQKPLKNRGGTTSILNIINTMEGLYFSSTVHSLFTFGQNRNNVYLDNYFLWPFNGAFEAGLMDRE